MKDRKPKKAYKKRVKNNASQIMGGRELTAKEALYKYEEAYTAKTRNECGGGRRVRYFELD